MAVFENYPSTNKKSGLLYPTYLSKDGSRTIPYKFGILKSLLQDFIKIVSKLQHREKLEQVGAELFQSH